jgi:hypothetical protein
MSDFLCVVLLIFSLSFPGCSWGRPEGTAQVQRIRLPSGWTESSNLAFCTSAVCGRGETLVRRLSWTQLVSLRTSYPIHHKYSLDRLFLPMDVMQVFYPRWFCNLLILYIGSIRQVFNPSSCTFELWQTQKPVDPNSLLIFAYWLH